MDEEEKDGTEQEQEQETPQETPQDGAEQAKDEQQYKDKGESLSDVVERIKAQYEEREAAQKEMYEKALKERDETIKNLLFGNGDEESEEENAVIERIRAARGTYKKW